MGALDVDVLGRWMLLAAGDASTQDLSIISPASPATRSIVDLAVLTLAITGLIFVVVEGVLLYSVWRFRQREGHAKTEPAQVYGSQPIEIAWTAAPTMIVFFLVLVTTRTLWEVNPSPPASRPDDTALYVTVIGHQWWWEYVYETWNGDKLDFITANELHIPVSEPETRRPVYLKLQSADVCHSYWVPRLGGKVDLIPGRSNTLKLESDQPGLFLGQCAEYCGAQHANMLLRVVVDSPAEFDVWLKDQALAAEDDPREREGRAAFLSQSCVNCHRVRGTPAVGNYAPDLTHLMSRATLASGEIENTRENLAHWVRDPQSIKPGCLMPAFGLGDREGELIERYLMTLR
jgi:cytochrome c oxidase subunit II